MPLKGLHPLQIKEYKTWLWEKSQKCGICGKRINSKKEATFDHIRPTAWGGSDHISNLQLTHTKCNCEKGSVLPLDQFKGY